MLETGQERRREDKMDRDVYHICPECAYSTPDSREDKCPHCRTDLLESCPLCLYPFREKRSIYCLKCGNKLRISYVPIQ